jgi:hypothetical protein
MLPFQYIFLYVQKTELTEKGNFCFFAANRKWKRQTSVCFLQMEKENRKFGRTLDTVQSICCLDNLSVGHAFPV